MEATTGPAVDGWKPRALKGLMERLGPLWTRREAAGWAYGLMTGPELANPAGLVHGGAITALADHALSTIAWEAAGRLPCMTVQLDVQFLAAVRPGAFLEARGRVARQSRSLLFLQGALQVGAEEVALASGVWKIAQKTEVA